MNTKTVDYESKEESIKNQLPFMNIFRQNAKMFMLIAGVAIVAIIVLTVLWAKEKPYGVLFSNVSDKDGGEIISQLTVMNIPYKFSSSGTSILVPEESVNDTRLRLAQQGLPKGGVIGFELLDKESFGMSQFNEQINYQRALEGELARTISTIDVIDSARVHLAIPKSSVFIRERKLPSASVTLSVLPGRALTQMQIDAIVHLVSSSVPDLAKNKVSVIDQKGNLLTGDNTIATASSTQIEFAEKIEERVRQRIERILEPIVGQGNYNIQVNADIDFSRQESTTETFDPNSNVANQTIRSRQLSENSQLGPYTEAGGVPGALSNQPVPQSSAVIDDMIDNKDGTKSQQQVQKSSQRNDTINYEVNRQIVHSNTPEGRIKRLTVAILVNYIKVDAAPATTTDTTEDNDENEDTAKTEDTGPSYQQLGDDVLKKIEELARQSMGFSAQRGDTLTVANVQFSRHQQSSSEDKVDFWKTPEFYDLSLTLGRYLILAIIAWILWRNIFKPVLVRVNAQYLSDPKDEITVGQEIDAEYEQLHPDYKKIHRKVFEDNLEQQEYIREMVAKDPRVLALIIRNWMEEEEEGNIR